VDVKDGVLASVYNRQNEQINFDPIDSYKNINFKQEFANISSDFLYDRLHFNEFLVNSYVYSNRTIDLSVVSCMLCDFFFME